MNAAQEHIMVEDLILFLLDILCECSGGDLLASVASCTGRFAVYVFTLGGALFGLRQRGFNEVLSDGWFIFIGTVVWLAAGSIILDVTLK